MKKKEKDEELHAMVFTVGVLALAGLVGAVAWFALDGLDRLLAVNGVWPW